MRYRSLVRVDAIRSHDDRRSEHIWVRITSLPGCTPGYDGGGNLTNDCSHTYNWLADGTVASVDTVSLTYDALGRVVEQARGSSYTQIVYSPGGGKLALMNGTSIQKAFIPLPGGGTAVYTSAGLTYYRHADWLGSSRLATTPTAPTTLYAAADYYYWGLRVLSSCVDDRGRGTGPGKLCRSARTTVVPVFRVQLGLRP